MKSRAEQYREHARRCELRIVKTPDLRLRAQLRRERQEWLELAASREAADRATLSDLRPLDEDMTLRALRAFEAGRGRQRPN